MQNLPIQKLLGLSEIAPQYDGILFDLYGVIHNGVACFESSITCLQALSDAGIPYAFLSNMPLRAAGVQPRLLKLGMPEALIHEALTSGEAVFRTLRAGGIGKRYVFQGPDSTRGIVPEGYDEVPIEAADFVLVSGIGDDEGPEAYAGLLKTALERGLPMICANPDLKVGHGDRVVSCAGLLVEAYERMGGDARWMGKPDKAVFEMAQEMLGGKLLMVGDSLRTDIAGAIGAGLDAVLVEAGIHADEAKNGITTLTAQYGVEPTFTISHVKW